MSKLKKILAVGLFLSSTFFMGCDDLTSNDDSVSFGTLTPSHIDMSVSGIETATVEVEASEIIVSSTDISVAVEDSDGNNAASYVDVGYTYVGTDKGTITITVDPEANCPQDTFTVTVAVSSGSANGSKSFTVYVTDGSVGSSVSTYSNVKIMVAAASGDNANNCASVDGSTFTYTQGTANSALQAKCDFVYYYTTEAVISAPNAVPSIINDSYADWTTLNATKFKVSSSTAWDAATATSDASIVTAATGASANQATGLAVDDVYAFVTAGGKMGLIKVVALAPGYDSDKYITVDIKVQD